jgi:hypothetical protein
VDVLTALQGAGGTISLGVGLLIIIIWLFRSLYLERKGRDADVARLTAEIKRLNDDHDAELEEVRGELRLVREARIADEARFSSEIARLNQRLDAEMEARRRAQFGEHL